MILKNQAPRKGFKRSPSMLHVAVALRATRRLEIAPHATMPTYNPAGTASNMRFVCMKLKRVLCRNNAGKQRSVKVAHLAGCTFMVCSFIVLYQHAEQQTPALTTWYYVQHHSRLSVCGVSFGRPPIPRRWTTTAHTMQSTSHVCRLETQE
jgi:hypothetical protein